MVIKFQVKKNKAPLNLAASALQFEFPLMLCTKMRESDSKITLRSPNASAIFTTLRAASASAHNAQGQIFFSASPPPHKCLISSLLITPACQAPSKLILINPEMGGVQPTFSLWRSWFRGPQEQERWLGILEMPQLPHLGP